MLLLFYYLKGVNNQPGQIGNGHEHANNEEGKYSDSQCVYSLCLVMVLCVIPFFRFFSSLLNPIFCLFLCLHYLPHRRTD